MLLLGRLRSLRGDKLITYAVPRRLLLLRLLLLLLLLLLLVVLMLIMLMMILSCCNLRLVHRAPRDLELAQLQRGSEHALWGRALLLLL